MNYDITATDLDSQVKRDYTCGDHIAVFMRLLADVGFKELHARYAIQMLLDSMKKIVMLLSPTLDFNWLSIVWMISQILMPDSYRCRSRSIACASARNMT